MSDNYAIWKPEYGGHAPPYWREGMKWDCKPFCKKGLEIFSGDLTPQWFTSQEYKVPAEALSSPNDELRDAKPTDPRKSVHEALAILRGYSPDELAKHGITLEPPKDWERELWADLLESWDDQIWTGDIREGKLRDCDKAAIELLRTRFEQIMKGEG